jgi:hypothetical protein
MTENMYVKDFAFFHLLAVLKVDGNEKSGGSERWQWLGISLGLWRLKAICHLNMLFLCKN